MSSERISEVCARMIDELPPIDIRVIWQECLDDAWHRLYDSSCPVCKYPFCEFE